MPQIEKSVFISYRRTNIFHARATFQDLRAHQYDVFMDYETMNAGDFEQIILNQIKARAHFLVILTPSALERCVDPNDWLRREIETAIDYKRNIIPLMFDGFDWVAVRPYLTGKLATLSNFNALPIPSAYFDEAMNRLRTRFLNVDITTVLYPTPKADESAVARKIAEATNQPTVTEKQLSASEYFERGTQHIHAGRYDDAIRDYTETVRLNPQYANAYVNRGVAYADKNDYDRAIADYNEAIRLNPQDADAYYNRGLAYYNKNDYDRAIADYNEAIRLNPQYASAYVNRAIAYRQGKNDYDRAIADYNEAIRLNPQYADAYNNRGSAYYNKKDYDRAIADFDRALQIDPNVANARNNREIALRMKRGG
ncbi:MAG: tetratricopeptide repeat protein [bacterium]|nr:tetratricopeptide repeat protein [bacterium]